MGTRLKQEQRYRLHRWLDGMPPADVWGRTAVHLAAEASAEVGCPLTPRVLERARLAIVPRPPKEPDPMVTLLTRLAQAEARLSILEQQTKALAAETLTKDEAIGRLTERVDALTRPAPDSPEKRHVIVGPPIAFERIVAGVADADPDA